MTEGGRCGWADSSPAMGEYHDREWGVPSHDETHLFEMLMLEGALGPDGWNGELLSYEAPTYFGMLCAAYSQTRAS